MKCLLSHRGIAFPKGGSGHDLEVLFNLLPYPEQKRIEEIHREQAAQHGRSAQKANAYFYEALNMAKDDFKVVRYVYERIGGHETRNLGPIILAVYSYIFEVCPDWSEQKLDFGLTH